MYRNARQSRRWRVVCYIAALLFLSTTPVPAQLTAGFSWQRDLMRSTSDGAGVGIVELDGAAHDAWSGGPDHLMVLDRSSSLPVPVIVRDAVASEIPTTEDLVPMTILSWVTQAEAGVEIVLEMKDITQLPSRFRIGSDRNSYHVHCSIKSSVDCVEWTSIAQTQSLFSVAGSTLKQSDMAIEFHGAFFFKVLLTPPGEDERAQLKMASPGASPPDPSLEFASNDLQFIEGQGIDYNDHGFRDDRARALVLESGDVAASNVFTFTSDRLPIRRLEFDVGRPYANLPVRVLGRNRADEDWSEIAHSELHQFPLLGGEFKAMSLGVDSVLKFSFYRVELAEAVEHLGVNAWGPAVWMQFPCEASHSYQLYYGGSSTTAVAMADMLDGSDVPFQLGPQQANPDQAPTNPPPAMVTVPIIPEPPKETVMPAANGLKEKGRKELVQVTLGLLVVCWLWFLGRLFKGTRT
jgi:hypothetical protein